MKQSISIKWPLAKRINAADITAPVWAKTKWHDLLLTNWRRWRLRKNAQQLGDQVKVIGRSVIINHGKLEVGDQVQLVSDYQPTRLAIGRQGKLTIGKGTTINSSILAAEERIEIGEHCRLAPFVHFMDSDFHDVGDRLAEGKSAPIIIGKNVQIGAHTLILRGVTIGDDAIILPGSVVTKDIPAHTLAGGVPAKVMDRRKKS